jgi:4'-phosphopantetheinyl transferase
MLRWAVNTSAALSLPQPAFDTLVRLLDDEDSQHVLKNRQREDQARALLSRLAQRACAVAALGLSPSPSPPKRGRAANGRGRPFLDRAAASATDADAREALELAPNWNFSVSHEGEWVLLVSEPFALCGLDVAAPRRHRRPRAEAAATSADDADSHPFLRSLALLRDSLTNSEWEDVRAPLAVDSSNEAAAEAAFLRAWAAKEAFVKARGDGLAFSPLSRVEAVWSAEARLRFADPEAVAEAARTGAALAVGSLRVDGVALERWSVASHPLEGGAWAAVIKGPASETADARLHPDFVASLTRPEMVDGEGAGGGAPPPCFRVLMVEDLLLSEEEREALRRARGDH